MGYKTPPTGSQWQPGCESPNPSGRPTGSRNEAGMITDLLNRPVRVTSDGETREMPAVEALFRVWTVKAGNGDSKAAAVVSKLHAMAGLETSFAEVGPPRLKLPQANTEEQFRLIRAPAREKDRQRYLARAEMHEDARFRPGEGAFATPAVPPAVKDGDRLALKGEFDEALAKYRLQLRICETDLTAHSGDKAAQYDLRRAVARIGLLADMRLHIGDYGSAISLAEEAIAAAKGKFWIAPERPFEYIPYTNTIWIGIVRALSQMFLHAEAEAEAYLLIFNGDRKHGLIAWEQVILREFVQLRAAGHSHPLMKHIEKTLYDRGWVAQQLCRHDL